MERISRGMVERVARIVGPLSAAQKSLDEYDRRKAHGEDVEIFTHGNSFVVGPKVVNVK